MLYGARDGGRCPHFHDTRYLAWSLSLPSVPSVFMTLCPSPLYALAAQGHPSTHTHTSRIYVTSSTHTCMSFNYYSIRIVRWSSPFTSRSQYCYCYLVGTNSQSEHIRRTRCRYPATWPCSLFIVIFYCAVVFTGRSILVRTRYG